MEQSQEPEQPYQLKRTKLSNYQPKFAHIKTDFLHLKFVMDTNVEVKGSKLIMKRMDKVAKLLFEIESDFRKDKEKK